MIEVKKTTTQHLKMIQVTDDLINFDTAMVANMMDPNKDIVSLIVEDKVIAIAGINHLRLGVCEAWIIRGVGIDDHKFDFFKTIKRLIDFTISTMDVHRFEIAIENSWEKGHKWAKTLGLKFEHVCRSYDYMKRDHAIYTRIV